MPRLEIRIIEARNVPDGGLTKPDPYVKVSLGSTKYKTSVQRNSLNPRWEQVFKLNVTDPSSERVSLRLLNSNPISDDDLGSYDLTLAGLVQNRVEDKWLLLSGGSKGGQPELRIAYQALDFGDAPGGASAVSVAPQRPGGLAASSALSTSPNPQSAASYSNFPPQQSSGGYNSSGAYTAPVPGVAVHRGQSPQSGYPPQQGSYPPPRGSYPPAPGSYPPAPGHYTPGYPMPPSPHHPPGYPAAAPVSMPPPSPHYPPPSPGYPVPAPGGMPPPSPGYPVNGPGGLGYPPVPPPSGPGAGPGYPTGGGPWGMSTSGPVPHALPQVMPPRPVALPEDARPEWDRLGLSQWEYDHMAALFIQFDESGSQTLHRHEMGKLARCMNFAQNDAAIDRLFRDMDTTGSGRLTFSEFIRWIARHRPDSKALYNMDRVAYHQVLMAFRGVDQDNDGRLRLEEFAALCYSERWCKTEMEVRELFRRVDASDTGFVTLHEMLSYRGRHGGMNADASAPSTSGLGTAEAAAVERLKVFFPQLSDDRALGLLRSHNMNIEAAAEAALQA